MKDVETTEKENSKKIKESAEPTTTKAVYHFDNDFSLWDESDEIEWETVAGNKFYTLHEYYEQAWLEVKLDEVLDFGIENEISPYSYYKGNTVYLSREDDMHYFVEALKSSGKDFRTKASYLSKWPFFLSYTPFELPLKS